MVWDIILWIIIGAVAGWIASKIMRTDAHQGGLMNIVVGILGALLGGFLVRMATGASVDVISIPGLLVAILGAVILLAIVKAVTGGSTSAPRV